jgi:iron(III) transport system substrate-binding protein
VRRPLLAFLVLSLFVTTGCGLFGDDDADIQVYTARHYDLEEAFEDFTEETGLSVEFLPGDDAELLERLKSEGDDTPADVFMTVDAGMLWNAAEQDQLAAIDSSVIEDAVPEDLRDPEGRWTGLAMRARTVMYNPDAVDPSEFDAEDTYAGLGDPKWQGRICMRDETASYTQSLVASLIDLHGRDRALEIVTSWVDNDVDVMSNDIELLEAIDAGGCDVGITNHYYLARKLEEDPDFNVKPFWASQEGDGTHVNISGAGVVAASDAKDDAQQLIEWLATDGQSPFVDDNHEYPVNPDVQPDELAASFGEFERMPVDAAAYGSLNADAVEVLDGAGYR